MNPEQSFVASPNSLAEQAYRMLEERLVKLTLEPGTFVSEGDLIDLTGIGRTPVREAIQRLAHQELIHIIPRKGLLITPVSREDMLHVLEAGRPLERLIVHRASVQARDAERSSLAAIGRQLSVLHERVDAFFALERSLCGLLDSCSANPFATASVAPLRSHCRRFWNAYRDRLQLAEAISVYSRMARLIARRDWKGARTASDTIMSVLERLVTGMNRVS